MIASNVKSIFSLAYSGFRRAIRSSTLVVTLVVVALFNVLTADESIWSDLTRPGWLFDSAPQQLWSLINGPVVLAVALCLWVLKMSINITVAYQMLRAYTNRPLPFKQALNGLSLPRLVWYAAVQILLFVVVAVIFGILWLAGWVLWHEVGLDVTLGIIVVCVIGYPLYTCWSATGSFIAVLPVGSSSKNGVLRRTLSPRVSWTLYWYYAARIGAEALVLGVGLYLAVAILNSKLAAQLVIAIALLMPLLFIRTVTYMKTVTVLSTESAVETAFADILKTPGLK
ncbi:hypothetical protein [Kribbella sp. CA-294648]|uniref:hypothetical protein n=1 Tax=Kribbella sp. CA-294648 TaxID=3239948 RepID=UPI003D8F9EAD